MPGSAVLTPDFPAIFPWFYACRRLKHFA